MVTTLAFPAFGSLQAPRVLVSFMVWIREDSETRVHLYFNSFVHIHCFFPLSFCPVLCYCLSVLCMLLGVLINTGMDDKAHVIRSD